MFATRGEIYVSALQHMANQLKNGLSVLQQVSQFQAKSLICVGVAQKKCIVESNPCKHLKFTD